MHVIWFIVFVFKVLEIAKKRSFETLSKKPKAAMKKTMGHLKFVLKKQAKQQKKMDQNR